MRRIKITGIVRAANTIRDALTRPLTGAERDALALQLDDSITSIETILNRHGAGPRHLPPPSRRAYEFLKRIDLSNIPLAPTNKATATAHHEPPNTHKPESVTFRGLRAFLDRLLDDIALTLHTNRFNAQATLRVIRNTQQRLDQHIERDKLKPIHLKPESRELVGWFRWFAGDEPFVNYVAAVQRSQQAFTPLANGHNRWPLPFIVHYRPLRHLYRWTRNNKGTRIALTTPAITFDANTLDHLGHVMNGNRQHRQHVNNAMLAEPYQSLAAELEAAAGIVERTAGVAYDLADVYNRVNRHYFDGTLPRPKLTWNRTLTGTKFGHYEFVTDTVMLSSSLDAPDVPTEVIDHVMHHELLHKKHGTTWQGRRQHAHTPAFRAEEKTFKQYGTAVSFLNRYAQNLR